MAFSVTFPPLPRSKAAVAAPPFAVERIRSRPHSACPSKGLGHELLAAVAAQSMVSEGHRSSETGFEDSVNALGKTLGQLALKDSSANPGSLSARVRRPSESSSLSSSSASEANRMYSALAGCSTRDDSRQSVGQTARASATRAGLGPLTMPPARATIRNTGRRRNSQVGGSKCDWDDDAMIFEHIGLKAAQKFTNLREAFRFVDADKDGCVNRGEVRYFFRAYDLPETVADRFFDRLAQGARSIDYLDFVRCMTPAIECGQPPSRDSDSQVSTREPSPRRAAAAVDRQRAFEEEFRDVMEQIRMKAVQRLGHARELKRFVAARDGYVSRSELQHLFRAFCISQKTADAFFDRLAEMGSGDVEYEALMHWICPLLKDLPGVEGLQPQSEAAANLYVMPLWASSASADTERSGSSARSNTSSPIPTDELYDAGQLEAVRKNAERWGQMQAEVWADELRMLVKSIREKLPLKFKHAREAFRPLDVSRDGKVTPTEMRSFVRGFGWSHEVADRLFALLDTERRGEIEYSEFVRHFEEMLDSPLPCAHSAMPHSVTKWNKSMDPKLRRAVNDIACLIGDRLVTKYNNAREAFRHLDLTNDGWLTRTELRRFCRSMNFYGSEADMLFDALGGPAAVQIRMDAFVGMLESFASEVDKASSGARTLSGGDRWRVVEELRDLPRPGFSHT